MIREAARSAAKIASINVERVVREACYLVRGLLIVPRGMNEKIDSAVADGLHNLTRRAVAELGFTGPVVTGVTVIPWRKFPPLISIDLGVAEMKALDLVVENYGMSLKQLTPGTLTSVGIRRGVVNRFRKELGRIREILAGLDPTDARWIIWGHLVPLIDELRERYSEQD